MNHRALGFLFCLQRDVRDVPLGGRIGSCLRSFIQLLGYREEMRKLPK